MKLIIHKEAINRFKEELKPHCTYFFIINKQLNYKLKKVCLSEKIRQQKVLKELSAHNEDLFKRDFNKRLCEV